ncbi:hypothetical protein Pelo_5010 [Pelomyxa schiedti]|nr:hypothetical protein Pelo_5010 [Pelomyxa schiedti]
MSQSGAAAAPQKEQLFTLKVIRAAKLEAKDSNGLSDPFVEVPTHKGKSKCTKVVPKNLNPVWNEYFLVKGPLLRVGVFDQDLLSANDLIGYGDLDLLSLADGKEHDIRLTGENGSRKNNGKLIGHLFVSVLPGDTRPADAKVKRSLVPGPLPSGSLGTAKRT